MSPASDSPGPQRSEVGSLACAASPSPPRFRIDASVYWQIGILGILVVLLFRHELYRLTYVWSNNGTWSHGWLVPVFSIYFLYTLRERLLAAPARTNWLGFLIVLGALLLYAAAIWPLQMSYPKSLAIVALIFGVVLWLCGWRIARVCLFPILYLLLALPLPDRLYVQATMPMRFLATKVTTVAIQATVPDLMAEPTGTTIVYLYNGKTGKLNVAEACSGMRSLMGLCAIGVALAFLGKRPYWQRIVVVTSCVPIAVLCNVLRVYITSMLQVHGYQDLAQGSAHTLLGILTFMLAAGLFLVEAYVLANLFIDDPEDADTDPEPAAAQARESLPRNTRPK